ncbi:ketopantoate reductase family protein [Halobellus clavatus]|jgi:2-dehydropantoate 2-reductase|uniref:2-dehydropantoate 2-reductase n=1 Tax=Halobellus clavatus TaxID=660517 RepID=A0A1H3DN06_9EURY|nr:2-dehydropantoate 2-reductase [Halobellus clavatus]SDX67044.1 2-dehydropantoate 2-reductase [Halobellus clavatus]
MEIVVFGAGSIGSLLGALLARVPDHDVTLVGRGPHVSAIRRRGLRVEGIESFTVEPQATTDGTDLAADLVLVTVKAYDTEAAARELRTGEFDAVCSLQNGMGNEETLAGYLDCPVLGGTTSYGAVRTDSGEVVWNGAGEIAVGPWAPRGDDETAATVGAAMTAAGLEVDVVDGAGIRRRLWEKLAVNAAINPTTALARVENGALGDEPGTDLVEPIAREVGATARAEGVTLSDEALVDAVGEVVTATAENESSMYADVQAARRTEIDVINGYVVERAREHGIDVPTNRTLWTLLRAWEAERGLRAIDA